MRDRHRKLRDSRLAPGRADLGETGTANVQRRCGTFRDEPAHRAIHSAKLPMQGAVVATASASCRRRENRTTQCAAVGHLQRQAAVRVIRTVATPESDGLQRNHRGNRSALQSRPNAYSPPTGPRRRRRIRSRATDGGFNFPQGGARTSRRSALPGYPARGVPI